MTGARQKGEVAVAWGDESIVDHGRGAHTYLLCAVTCLMDEAAEAGLARLRALKPVGARKLHWHDMTDALRAQAAETIASMPLSFAVVSCPYTVDARSERARRKCLETLLWFLESDSISQFNVEARDRRSNERDRRMRAYLRGSHVVGSLRLEHVPLSNSDARLWIPDQILGIFVGVRFGRKDATWLALWDQLRGRMVELETRI